MFLEILKAIIYGIVEGITEWLPISSTGHLILLEQLLPLKASDAFMSMFDVVIQLGAILAVIVLFSFGAIAGLLYLLEGLGVIPSLGIYTLI